VEPVLSPAEAWSQDQAQALRVEQPCSGATLRTLGLPFRLSETPAQAGGVPPELGVHADAVLAAAGLEAGEVGRLREMGVLA
jgi:crotonobetainyl-CoA:carnitine CoA-transferase CaiB-like acyl-CoA transferase